MHVLLSLISALVVAIGPAPAPTPSDASAMKSLIVTGDGFTFSVREPDGWRGDIGTAATLKANIMFYRETENPKTFTTDITISVLGKEKDFPVSSELQYDMDQYHKQFPAMTFEDFTADRPGYNTYSKVYIVPEKLTNYVSYIDPGPAFSYYMIVCMQPPGDRASADELQVYAGIVSSLDAMNVNLQLQP